MMFLDLDELESQADANISATAIQPVSIRADVLKQLVSDAKRYKEFIKRWPAPERDPRDMGKRMKSEGFLLLSSMKHMAEKHYGNTFADLESTVELLENCFESIYLGQYSAAKTIIGALDGGWSHVQADEEIKKGEWSYENIVRGTIEDAVRRLQHDSGHSMQEIRDMLLDAANEFTQEEDE